MPHQVKWCEMELDSLLKSTPLETKSCGMVKSEQGKSMANLPAGRESRSVVPAEEGWLIARVVVA
jgi:hypothetical protein